MVDWFDLLAVRAIRDPMDYSWSGVSHLENGD